MNKKVALSLLSATVFASMAASAFAAPKAGVYMGGEVDRYYALTDLFKLNDQGLTKFQSDLTKAGFDNIVFVDTDKKGAFLKDFLTSNEDYEKIKRDLKQSDFEGAYTQANIDGTDGESYDPRKDITPDPTGELKVESVSAINAKQIEVKFGKAIDEATVINTATGKGNGLIGNAVKIAVTGSNNKAITVAADGDNTAGTSASAELSADGKTLTITAAGNEVFDGSYSITFVKDAVKDEDGNKLAETVKLFDAKDSVRPTFAGVKYTSNKKALFTFSEPIKSEGTVSFKVAADGSALPAKGADNTNAPVIATLTADGLEIDMSNLNDNLKNKDITVTVVGAEDFAGLLLSPNPFVQNVKFSTDDAVAPTVASVTALSNKTVEVKFSEELSAAPTIKVGAATATVKQDATDKTKYVGTLASAVSGLQTVEVSAFSDKSGNAGTTFSKVVNFTVDTTAPTVSSTKVEKIEGVEYLVVTFSENVDVTVADTQKLTFTYVKDFVSKSKEVTLDASGDADDNITLYKPVGGKSASVKIALTDLTDAATYTVNLPAGLVKDLNGNASEAKASVSFTRGTDAVSDKPEIDTNKDNNGIEKVDSNKVKVYFKNKVDGSSATNKANYSIEGSTIDKAELLQNDGTGAVVQLTLVKDSSTFSGNKTVSVSGVKSETGVVMDAYTTYENLDENVRPTVVSAALTANDTITLTFSEAVTNDSVKEGTAKADFEVFVGGVKYATAFNEDTDGGVDSKKVVLKLASGTFSPSDLSAGIVVKASVDFDVADGKGNVANFTSVNVQ